MSNSELVVVRTYLNNFDAEVAKSALEAANIDAMIKADDCGGVRPGLWMSGVEYLCADADKAVAALAAAGRKFEFVMEDIDYGDGGERSLPLARALATLVARDGVLVANRHRRREAALVIDALRPLFRHVRERRVRREGENVLVVATRPRATTSSAAS